MNALILFWSIVGVLTWLLVTLRRVADDDPWASHDYTPPRSHPTDAFERTGSSFR
ncbi:hypothetical protein [Nocardioides acrostichi]|uniref:Uncharacterized protein n=1 Tax=Nocardioides acrostichi TaxID=2784339 RepID=A0A930YAZ9_9ACTN|nr:hypothetical protein [Nocardioides acrostichi]MBF4161918.1 hypothetical protein [Nocardioides acrostichi]